jgi:predicted RNase H-like nuclease
LDFGFTSTEVDGEERPHCTKVLASECMLPSKLKRHLQTTHPSVVSKSRVYFSMKRKELNQQKDSFHKQASIPSNALLASYKVAHRIAKCKRPDTIAEELILPAAVDMVNIVIGESGGKLLSKGPFSNNTVSRRIQHKAEDLNDQLIEK